MSKYKAGTDQAVAANEELAKSISDLMFDMSINTSLNVDAQTNFASTMGYTSEEAQMMQAAIVGLTAKYDYNKNGLLDLEELTKSYYNDYLLLEGAFTDQTATFTLVYQIVGHPPGWVADNRTSGTWGGATMADILGKKHGGSIYGGQHGMIVPPGFSNDGMPVMVSSGERLDVTPAGNKNMGGDSELTAMIADLKYTMDGLPRLIRDAVMMA
jgi:hypothetical protein